MKSAAIIGCGRPPQNMAGHKVGWGVALGHADGYLKAFPDIAIYAVDPNAGNLAAFAEKWSIPRERCFASTQALYAAATPESASICTWPGLHVPQAIEACRAGVKLITVEKPLALDNFQIQELISTARSTGTRVAVAHQRRYEPPFEQAKKLIADGAVGQNVVIEARVGDNWDILSWTTHWFDMANYFFDGPPMSVLAGVDHTGQRRYGHAVEDASIIFADYGRARQAVFITGPEALPNFGITVRGERGMMVVGNPIKLWTTDGYREIIASNPEFTSAYAMLFADLWSTRDGGLSRCDIANCAPATAMAYAAHESARTMRRVPIPLTAWYAPLEVVQHAPAVQKDPPLSIAVLADRHHEWAKEGETPMAGRVGLSEAIEALGHRVTNFEAADELPANAFDGVDVLVLYHTQRKTRDSHRQLVGKWVASGKPVVVSHCGIGAYPDWQDFRRWTGLYWVWGGEPNPPSWHPHVSCELSVDDSRFDVPWTGAWLPIDEVYQRLGEGSAIKPLVTATAPDGTKQTYGWQVTNQPNVVVWLPGHRRDMFALPVVRDGLKAAIRMSVARQKTD